MNIQLDRTTPQSVDSTAQEVQPLLVAGSTAQQTLLQAEMPVSSSVAQDTPASRNGAPALPQPVRSSVLTRSEYTAFPALGASFMALMTETQSQQRKLSAQQRALETDLMCANMNEQAKKITSKAITGLVFGIVTSSLSIAQGIVTASTQAKGLNKIAEDARLAAVNPDLPPVNIQTEQMLLTQKIAMQNSVFSAGSTSLSKIGEATSGFMDADIKRSEINIERSRANVDALRALEESSQSVITKALAAMEAIQSSTNQATQRILG